ncbi:MAG: hypothetical protein QM736_11435 [Vicinamibacterales bacterium]
MDRAPESNADLAGHWTAELDRHGVASATVISSIPGDEASVIEAVAAQPARLHGQFLLNPLAPDAAERLQSAFLPVCALSASSRPCSVFRSPMNDWNHFGS